MHKKQRIMSSCKIFKENQLAEPHATSQHTYITVHKPHYVRKKSYLMLHGQKKLTYYYLVWILSFSSSSDDGSYSLIQDVDSKTFRVSCQKQSDVYILLY